MTNWKTNLVAALIAQFLCIVGFTAAYSYIPFYIRDLGVTDVNQVTFFAGLQLTAGGAMAAVASPLWGMLADRYGRRAMVQRAAFGGAVVVTAMAFVSSAPQLVVLRGMEGALTGTVPAFVALVASFAPQAEIGFALGLMQMAVYLGYTVGPLIGGLIADRLGYRWTFGATGLLLLGGGLLVHFVIRETFKPGAIGRSEQTGLRDAFRAMTHSLPMIGAAVALGGIYMGTATPQPITALFVESLQKSEAMLNTNTGLVFGVNAVASSIAAVFIGRMSDRIGYRRVLLIASVGTALSYVGQAISPSVGFLIAASFATGLCTGGLLPVANAILARNAPPSEQGAIYGISNSLTAAGRAAGPMLGAACAASWGLRASFGAAAVLYVLVSIWVAFMIGPKAASWAPRHVKATAPPLPLK
jgi:MFS transporter, DHA1 family, multidrug resistance protein